MGTGSLIFHLGRDNYSFGRAQYTDLALDQKTQTLQSYYHNSSGYQPCYQSGWPYQED